MGIKRLQPAMIAIAKSSGSKQEPVTPASEGVPVLAIDANSLMYWAYDTMIAQSSGTEGEKKTTSMNADEIIRAVVRIFITALGDLNRCLAPEVLLITLDGVPPLAKIIDQRSRRSDAPPTDLHSSDGKVVFSTSWLAPNSPMLVALDQALKTLPVKGSVATIYSGPGVAGEGEHKIFPILQALARHGLSSVATGKKNEHLNEKWRPTTIIVFGNDNDLYLLSMMFLATFKERPPRVLLYNDRQTRKSLALAKKDVRNLQESADNAEEDRSGILRISSASDIYVYDIQLLLNAVTGDGRFSSVGATAMEKVVHFVHATTLLGNDFLPKIELGGTSTNTTLMLEEICGALRDNRPYIDAAVINTLPLLAETSELPCVTVVTNKANFTQTMRDIHERIDRNATAIGGGPHDPVTVPQEALRMITHSNGIRPQDSNKVAVTAACDYVRLMDSVISYYVSSTCVIPQMVMDSAKFTMPNEYYAYGMAPPAYNYLTAAAQFLAAVQENGAPNYPHFHQALGNFSISSIEHARAAVPAEFIDCELHSALIFPGRSVGVESSGYYISASSIAKEYYPMYPVRTSPGTNHNMLPLAVLESMSAYLQSDSETHPLLSVITTELTRQVAGTSKSLYVADALAV